MSFLLQWVQGHDRGLVSLRRATRTAIIMPGLFALAEKVIHDPVVATFAAFGAFALLLLVDFSGPMRDRLQAQFALSVVGAIFVCVGSLAGRAVWLSTIAMALVAFGVIFSGLVSSVLAAATTSLLLAFILSVTFAGPVSSIPARLAGWGLASGASMLAISLLWPAPTRDPLRSSAIVACRAIAARLRADVAYLLGGPETAPGVGHDEVMQRAEEAALNLQSTFLATPYRPTGLGTAARSVVRLVDEVRWLATIIGPSVPRPTGTITDPIAGPVRLAAAVVLERCADLLAAPRESPDLLERSLAELRSALSEMERRATAALPIAQFVGPSDSATVDPLDHVITSLDPSFRAQELAFATLQIGANVALTSAAERRGWLDRFLGRQPEGLAGTLSAAHELAQSHVERDSVWLHNSLRGAVGLGAAVLVANLSGVEHSFWVVLGTLSVLRSNALNTGQNALRGILGTALGFVVGGALVAIIGHETDVLWALLPIAILFAGFAPAAISFTAGQVAFTVTLVILYNIIQPAGWRIGLVRVEDITIGCAISLGVGLLFWPRGAGAALGRALSAAYEQSAQYLASAVEFGMGQCDHGMPTRQAPVVEANRAASASGRLDDTFRSYLAERGAKPVRLAEITSLVTGPAALRLAGDAVLDLWQRNQSPVGDRTGACREVVASTERVAAWYDEFASSLEGFGAVPAPQPPDHGEDARLLDAVGHDLLSDDGMATSTAVRMIWTSDHLDAARRLQDSLTGPAGVAVADHALMPSTMNLRRRRSNGEDTTS